MNHAQSASVPPIASNGLKVPADAGSLSDPITPLRLAAAAGQLRPLDLHFARWLGETSPSATPGCLLAAALTSYRVGQGDVCLDLSAVAGRAPFPGLPELIAPPMDQWRSELTHWPAVGRADPSARVNAPLVLDDALRLYLGRYWHYEQTLASAVRARAALWAGDLDRTLLAQGLTRMFPPVTKDLVDWQRVAAAMAALKPFCVISGGPGTGKTRTVTAILALIAEQGLAIGLPPRIGLAAPTGKAAARLTESIRKAKSEFLDQEAITESVAAAIPEEALTLHRLLGTRPGRVAPRHGPDNPLHLDLLVVDESSMLDLPMAARVLDALPPGCRLILIGDRDQLASVQAGAVLGDLCDRGREPDYSKTLIETLGEVAGVRLETDSDPGAQLGLDLDGRDRAPAGTGLSDCVALLRKSYRFRPGSGIHGVSTAINRGDGQAALSVLDSGRADASRLDISTSLDQHQIQTILARFVRDFVVPRHRAVLESPDPAAALIALGNYRVLCAVQEGQFGVSNLNRIAERALTAAGLIRPDGLNYPGRPLLVTANDYDLRLYNGDIGILLPDPDAGGKLGAWFDTAEGLRRLSPHRLPPVQTLFAMTVHKSQGSEFDAVALVLPSHDSRALTRELIYTGVTRARSSVVVVCPAQRLIQGVKRKIQRSSGLHDALWSPTQDR